MTQTQTQPQTNWVETAKAYAEHPPITADRRRTVALIALDGVFVTSCLVVSTHWQNLTSLPVHVGVLLAFATMRTAHTLSYNGIMEWMRAPFTQVEEHSSGAGDDVHARGKGFTRTIGELIECPVCTGTWAALALVALTCLYQPLGLVLAWVLGLAGVSELLHYAKEALEWHALLDRENTGWMNAANIHRHREEVRRDG